MNVYKTSMSKQFISVISNAKKKIRKCGMMANVTLLYHTQNDVEVNNYILGDYTNFNNEQNPFPMVSYKRFQN